MDLLWDHDIWAFVALVCSGAALCVLYATIGWRVVRSRAVPPRPLRALKFVAWVPPLGPLVGLVVGPRRLSALWFFVLALYLVLRSAYD